MIRHRMLLALASLLAVSAAATAAPGPSGHGHGTATPAAELLGTPAPKGQGRVVRIEMTDNAYNLKKIDVRAGEVVRFVIVNKGTLLHEFNMNTAAAHVEHRPMMTMMMEHGMITADRIKSLKMKMPDGTEMEHVEPNSVIVEPGKTAEISWRFTTAGSLEIACNIPGHYESGMVAPLNVIGR